MEKLEYKTNEFHTSCLVNVSGKEYVIFLENGENKDRVIYNPKHLHNFLPNRLVFRGIQNEQEGDILAINFLKNFGELIYDTK